MTNTRYVYEMVGGKADGKFLVVNSEVREYNQTVQALTKAIRDRDAEIARLGKL